MTALIKSSSIQKIKRNLENLESENVYICLLLRLVIEELVYTRLHMYNKEIIPLYLWKRKLPPKALKVLYNLEPSSSQSFNIDIMDEKIKKYIPLGTYKAINVKWLTKRYNKLGSFLHLSTDLSDNAVERNDLELIFEELNNLNQSKVLSSIQSPKWTFDCKICATRNWVHESLIHECEEIQCIGEFCFARYESNFDCKEAFFKLKSTNFICPSCDKSNLIANQRFGEGDKFICGKCRDEFVINSIDIKLLKIVNKS